MGIEPWLGQHLDEMSTLLRVGRWSWSDLARALNQAGITYANGGRWTADFLRVKAANVRFERRKRDRAVDPQYALPVEFLREALGNLGGINQLVVNVQSREAGPITAALSSRPIIGPAPPATVFRNPADAPNRIAAVTPDSEAKPASWVSNDASPVPRDEAPRPRTRLDFRPATYLQTPDKDT